MAKQDDELLPYKNYSAGHLFFLAKQAYERTISTESDREPGKSDAIVAVVFAASSLEAFINELADWATYMPDVMEHPESVQSFASLMREVENLRGSIRLKFMLTKLVFSGSTYKKDEQPFQDLSLLFMVRDALVHLKPQDEFKTAPDGKKVRVMKPKVLKALPKNILAKFDETIAADWKSMISTQAVAKWACNTAAKMVHSVLATLPESHFKKIVSEGFVIAFQSVK